MKKILNGTFLIIFLGATALIATDKVISTIYNEPSSCKVQVVLRLVEIENKYLIQDRKKITKEEILDFNKLFNKMKEIESSNKYNAINRLGYIGYTQFGVAALEDLGYVEKGEYKRMKSMKIGQKEFVLKHLKWVDGMSLNKYLKFHQREAFVRYCKINLRILKKNGFISSYSNIKEIQGHLFASHLIGINSYIKKLKGIKGKYRDGNGVSADTYFNIGKNV